MQALRALGSRVADAVGLLLAPPRCAACDGSVASPAVFCAACAAATESLSGTTPAARRDHARNVATAASLSGTALTAAESLPGTALTTAAFRYGGSIAVAIARLKYERRPDLGRPLGDLLWRALAPRGRELERACVVPVPLHPERLAERGYNQSALIAARVALGLRTDMAALALVRTRSTVQQATLDRDARRTNVANAFRVRSPTSVSGRRVLLVDDVRTTGVTLDACAHALHEGGAAEVGWAVVASSTDYG